MIGKLLSIGWLCATLSLAKTVTVKSGSSIQDALNRAEKGDTIEVEAGTYHEAVSVDKENIRLIGKIQNGKWPTLDGKNYKNDGIIINSSGVEVANFYIKDYKGNGIMSLGADQIHFHHLYISHTGIYGIYPTRGTNVIVEDTVTTEIADAGIYIGMCTHTEVRRNEVFGNVGGIEIENSTDVIVEDNLAHDNTAGILAFTLPGLPVKTSKNVIIRRNIVRNNNHVNFGPSGSVVSTAPQGSGFIVLAGDGVQFENNIVHGNKTGGIIFSDLDFIKDSSSPDPGVKPTYDNNKVLGNFFFDNGSDPIGKVKLLLAALHFRLSGADIIAHGKGQGNCLRTGASTVGTKEFKQCGEKDTTANIKTVIDPKALEHSFAKSTISPGERVFNISCAGCHGTGVQLIGPRIEEIQTKYRGNIKGIVDFAWAPSKVRGSQFPLMPSQSHLGKERIAQAAEFMMSLKR